MSDVSRPAPMMPVYAYQTFSVSAPPRTHWRKATCEEYLCEKFLYGFMTVLDLATDTGVRLADFIRHDITRAHKEIRTGLYEARFIFPPETPCWRQEEHRIPLERPSLYTVRGGDWRASTGAVRRHTRAEFWVEDFALHQQRLADIARRG